VQKLVAEIMTTQGARDGWPDRVDLYLGSPIGRWAFDQVRPIEVGAVWTDDEDLAATARHLGLTVNGPEPDAPTALSIHYPHVLPISRIDHYRAAYNLHPGLLPFGRGWYPVFWALYLDEPAGATLHRMVQLVDAGPIVDQIGVATLPDDTGGSLHERVTDAERTLFQRCWQRLIWGEALAERPQPDGGSNHSREEFVQFRDAPPQGSHLERLKRALTHPGYPLPAWATATGGYEIPEIVSQ
jgi:methionyl-tRNA formyltransferase